MIFPVGELKPGRMRAEAEADRASATSAEMRSVIFTGASLIDDTLIVEKLCNRAVTAP